MIAIVISWLCCLLSDQFKWRWRVSFRVVDHYSSHFHMWWCFILFMIGQGRVLYFTSIKCEGSFLVAPAFVFLEMMYYHKTTLPLHPIMCTWHLCMFSVCACISLHLICSVVNLVTACAAEQVITNGELENILFLMICLVSVPGNRLHFLCSTSHRMCWKLKKSFPISTLWRRRSATTLSGCLVLPKSAQPMHLRGPSLSSQTRWEDLRGFADFTPPFSLSCTWARSGGLGCAHLFGIFESTVYVTICHNWLYFAHLLKWTIVSFTH